MISYFEPNFIEKFHWESGFLNFAEIEMNISYLTAILKTVQIFFPWNMIVFNVVYEVGSR